MNKGINFATSELKNTLIQTIEPLKPYCERYYETNIKRKAA